MKRKLCMAGAALCCLLLTACGVKITGLQINMSESLPVGETALATINATYDKPDATDEQKANAVDGLEITFTSSDEKIATVDAKSGKVTAVSGGKVTITATAKDLSTVKEIEILVPIEGVNAPETLELMLNKADSKKLDAKPVPENATVNETSFESSDEKIATVSTDGTVTAVANGEAVITTTINGKTAETKVTVTTAATGIGLESDTGLVYVGGAYELKPYTLPKDAAASTYTYTSDNTGVATVNEKGAITGKAVGSAKITIKSAEGFETVYTITVKTKPAATKPSGTGSTGGNAGGGNTGGGTAPAPAPDPAPPAPAPNPPPAPAEPQHYHGNGSDGGVCPVCGLNFSPSVGVGGGAGEDQGELS